MQVQCASVSETLPTLLTSRRKVSDSGKNLAKRCAVEQPLRRLPDVYPMKIRVRNTFIDTAAERSPSLERFYTEREVTTCPSAHIGRFTGLFREADSSVGGDDISDAQLPGETPKTCSSYDMSSDNAISIGASAAPVLVLSLDDAIMASSQVSQTSACGQEFASPSAFTDGFPHVTGVPQPYAIGSGHSRTRVVLPSSCQFSEACPADSKGVASGVACLMALGTSSPPTGWGFQTVTAPPDHAAPGSEEMPSVGSAGHATGRCKPCAFFHKAEGCANGLTCQFCHLCQPDEKQRRRKEKLEARRASHKWHSLRRDGPATAPRDCQRAERLPAQPSFSGRE